MISNVLLFSCSFACLLLMSQNIASFGSKTRLQVLQSTTEKSQVSIPVGRDGQVVRALASHQCGPGSILRSGVSCGLSLLVLFPAPRGFSPGTHGFPLSPKTNISPTRPHKLTALNCKPCINKVSLPLTLTPSYSRERREKN